MNRKYHLSCNVVDDQTFLEVKHLFSQIICSNQAKRKLFCTLKQKFKFQSESHLIALFPLAHFSFPSPFFNLALSVPSLLAHYPSVFLSVCLFLTKFLTLARNTSIPRLRPKALSYFFQIAPIDVFWPSSESRLRFEMNGDELIEEPVLIFLILPALGTHASLWGAGGFDRGRQRSASICQLLCSHAINYFINRFIYSWWKRLWCIRLIFYISAGPAPMITLLSTESLHGDYDKALVTWPEY